jgi:S1-C subfamily serine protease
MRARSVPLLVLLAMGCRPTTGIDASPDEPLIDAAADDAGAGSTSPPAPEGPPRPTGAIFHGELVRATQGGSAAYLLSQLGPEAYRPQGRFEGWMITRVWPGDPQLCAPGCDLRAGDVILSVNGSKLETPEELSNLLARIDALESIDLTGIRDGEFFERSHPVLPDPVLPSE